MAKILIPTPLRQFAGKQDTVDLSGSTVGEVLKGLTSQFSDLRKHLYNDEGKLRSYVNIYLSTTKTFATWTRKPARLKDSDTISIVPSIAGGTSAGDWLWK